MLDINAPDPDHQDAGFVLVTGPCDQVLAPAEAREYAQLLIQAAAHAESVRTLKATEATCTCSFYMGGMHGYGPGGYNRCIISENTPHEWHKDSWGIEWKYGFRGSFVRRQGRDATRSATVAPTVPDPGHPDGVDGP